MDDVQSGIESMEKIMLNVCSSTIHNEMNGAQIKF